MKCYPLPVYFVCAWFMCPSDLAPNKQFTREIFFVVEGILISCRSVWLGWQPACASRDASWFGRQWCRTMKVYTSLCSNTPPTARLNQRTTMLKRKGSPLSNQSIIWCNSGSHIYVGLTFIIHKKGKWRGNEHKSFHFFWFISLLGRKNSQHPSLTRTQTHITHTLSLHEAAGFISILTCRENPPQELFLFSFPTEQPEEDWILTIQTKWVINKQRISPTVFNGYILETKLLLCVIVFDFDSSNQNMIMMMTI